MKRVVVTGIGAVTPVGNSASAFWESVCIGKNGIAPITRFDTSESKYKLAAEVKDFDPTQYMEKLAAKKLDLFTQYAMAAASEAMNDSSLEGKIEQDELAVYFGSGIGGFETFCESYDMLKEKGARRVSPLFIPKMINNIAAGNIAIRKKCLCRGFHSLCHRHNGSRRGIPRDTPRLCRSGNLRRQRSSYHSFGSGRLRQLYGPEPLRRP